MSETKPAITGLKVDCKYSVYFWSKVLNTCQIAHLDILLKFYYEIWKRTTPRVIFTEHGNTPNLGGFRHVTKHRGKCPTFKTVANTISTI